MNGRAVFIVQASRGPVLLITIGALFAMHQAGFLTFDRTWPLILIVLGIMKLLERVFAPPVVLQPPYPGAQYPHPPYPPPPPTGGPQA